MRSKRLVLGVLVLLALAGLCLAQDSGHMAEPTEEEPAGLFSGSLAEAWWTIVWFLLLMLVLRLFAWKPILQGLQDREEHIARQVSEAEQIKQKAREKLDEYNQKLATAEDEGRQIIASRMKIADKEAAEMTAKTQKELDLMRERAQTDIALAREQAQEQLRAEAGRMVIRLGEEILGRVLTEGDNQRLIDEAVAKLKEEEMSSGV